MSDATRSILHEVMEQQTVSIAKAGIVCTLNARTSILASANPKESRYNPKLSVVENVQIMPTLLSRFDLIYLVLDQPNESKDRKLAKHLVGLYHEAPDRSALEVIPMQLLTSYISFARRSVKPVLSSAAEEKLIEFYTAMRQQGGNQKVITATPRQLEALIRLAEALAKMQLKPVVSEEHVFEAKRLMDVATQRVRTHTRARIHACTHACTCMRRFWCGLLADCVLCYCVIVLFLASVVQAATDPTTGRIDMDLLQTGHSSADRKQVDMLSDALRETIEGQARYAHHTHTQQQQPSAHDDAATELALICLNFLFLCCLVSVALSKTMRTRTLFESFNAQLQQSSGSHISMDRFKEVLHLLEAESFIRMGHKDTITRV